MDFELKDVLRILRKRIWILLCTMVILVGATAIYNLFFVVPMYQASTKLIVNNAKIEDASGNNIDLNDVNFSMKLTQTYVEIIKTTSMMEKVAKDFSGLKMGASSIKSAISVSTIKDSQIITITAKSTSNEKAVKIANAVANTFVKQVPVIMNIDNVKVIDKAIEAKSAKPVTPDIEANIMTTVLISLVLGIGIIFLIEYFDDTLKTEEDITRYLKLPTIATIMSISQEEYSTKNDKNS